MNMLAVLRRHVTALDVCIPSGSTRKEHSVDRWAYLMYLMLRRFTAWSDLSQRSAAVVVAAIGLAALAFITPVAVAAVPATHADLVRFSREAANEPDLGAVEIGSGYIEGGWAVASWRSTDRKRHGQAVFFHACDHWNLAEVRSGAFTKSDLSRLIGVKPQTRQIIVRLAADSIQLQSDHTAYLPASRRTPTC